MSSGGDDWLPGRDPARGGEPYGDADFDDLGEEFGTGPGARPAWEAGTRAAPDGFAWEDDADEGPWARRPTATMPPGTGTAPPGSGRRPTSQGMAVQAAPANGPARPPGGTTLVTWGRPGGRIRGRSGGRARVPGAARIRGRPGGRIRGRSGGRARVPGAARIRGRSGGRIRGRSGGRIPGPMMAVPGRARSFSQSPAPRRTARAGTRGGRKNR